MPIDKNELSRLSPEVRIRKLRQLEEERKKEAAEIGELIRKSMQELKTEKLVEEITPERRPVDISRLFEADNEQRLEMTARKEVPPVALMKGATSYQAMQQVDYAYSQLNRLDKTLAMYGSLSEDAKRLVGEMGERLVRAEKYMTESERTASKLDASRFVLYKLRKETGID